MIKTRVLSKSAHSLLAPHNRKACYHQPYGVRFIHDNYDTLRMVAPFAWRFAVDQTTGPNWEIEPGYPEWRNEYGEAV